MHSCHTATLQPTPQGGSKPSGGSLSRCEKCGDNSFPASMYRCGDCDAAYHKLCLNPRHRVEERSDGEGGDARAQQWRCAHCAAQRSSGGGHAPGDVLGDFYFCRRDFSIALARWGLRAVLYKAYLAGPTALAECQLQLISAGACDVVMAAMQHHASEADVARHGVAVVACLAEDNPANGAALGAAVGKLSQGDTVRGARLGEAGACKAALRLLYISDNADMQDSALSALANLAKAEANRERLGGAGARRAVIVAMQAHPAHKFVQQNGLALIASLVDGSSINSTRLLDAGVCEVLVSGLQSTWLQDSVAVMSALAAVVNLSDTLPHDFAKFSDLCAAVMVSMTAYKQHVGVQVAAAHAIEGLACFDSACVELRSRNALAALADAMREHSDNADLCECALAAASMLIGNAPATLLWHIQGCVKFVRWGLLAVLAALEEADLADGTLLAECHLEIREAGACAAVVAATMHHASDAAVGRYGVKVIYMLARKSAACCVAFGAAGACEAVVSVLRRFTADMETKLLALSSLTHLATCPENRAGLRAAGACEELTRELGDNVWDREFLLAAVRAVNS
ncbi:armadillo-type protein [Tribonema minus]|uniref:Armadillo-type protein n=1 Tax=Tribonema minus TaxID=303371 RepID=A0A836CMG4_9STRA|nr:armadillo-type protein [Tribonema minus]